MNNLPTDPVENLKDIIARMHDILANEKDPTVQKQILEELDTFANLLHARLAKK